MTGLTGVFVTGTITLTVAVLSGLCFVTGGFVLAIGLSAGLFAGFVVVFVTGFVTGFFLTTTGFFL